MADLGPLYLIYFSILFSDLKPDDKDRRLQIEVNYRKFSTRFILFVKIKTI